MGGEELHRVALLMANFWDSCESSNIGWLVLPLMWWEVGLGKSPSAVSHLDLAVISKPCQLVKN